MAHLSDRQNGNALWFILIAIALLGLLTTLVSRSGSFVNQSGDFEKRRLKASALLRYAKSVESAVQNMRLQGISENDLDFVSISAGHDNPNCSTAECTVFDPYGGGVSFQSLSDFINDSGYSEIWHVSTDNRVYHMGCDDANKGCTELLLLAADIPKALCLEINTLQGITNPSGDAPRLQDISYGSAFAGTFSTSVNTFTIGGTNAADDAPELRGAAAGCFFEFGGGSNTYHFYQVLIPR